MLYISCIVTTNELVGFHIEMCVTLLIQIKIESYLEGGAVMSGNL